MASIPSLGNKFFTNLPNPLHMLEPFDEKGNVNFLVEIPQGTYNKIEYTVENGILSLNRAPFSTTPYPLEYGLIPKTWDLDNDMLDAISLIRYPTFPGCHIPSRIIGVMYMNDTGEKDNKILLVPAVDAHFDHIKTISDVPKLRLDEIQFFFEHYKDVQYKYKNTPNEKVTIEGWGGIEEAQKVITQAIEEYKKKFGNIS